MRAIRAFGVDRFNIDDRRFEEMRVLGWELLGWRGHNAKRKARAAMH